MKINSFQVTALPKSEHLSFITSVVNLAKQHEAIKTICQDEFNQLSEAHVNENKYFNLPKSSPYTTEIVDANVERDSLLTGIKYLVKGYLKHSDKSLSASAQIILDTIKRYDIRTGMQLDKKSGLIAKFVEDLSGDLLENVQALDLGHMVKSLQRANNKVDELLIERSKERTQYEIGIAKTTRTQSTAAYKQFVEFINSYTVSNKGYSEFDDFIKLLNEEIKRIKEQVLNRKKRTSKEENVEEMPQPEGVM